MLTLARQHYSALFMRQQQRDEKANTGATQQVQYVAGKVFWPDAHKCAAEGVSGADGVSVQRTRCTEDLSELRLQLAWLSAHSAGPRLSVGLVTSIWAGPRIDVIVWKCRQFANENYGVCCSSAQRWVCVNLLAAQ